MGRLIVPEYYILGKGDSGPKSENSIVLPQLGVAGKYRCQIRKARTNKLKLDTDWFDNLITNRGLVEWWNLTRFGSFDTGELGTNCCVGTGNTTPQVTDVQLANIRASMHSNGSNGGGTGWNGPIARGYVAAAGGNPAYWYVRYQYVFGTGTASGNLTEVGVFPGGMSSNADLVSRALIVDDLGNPTAITVLDDEILTVTWELRWYLDTTDHAFSFNLNGSPITGTYRLWQASSQQAQTDSISGDIAGIVVYSGAMAASPLDGTPSGTLGTINANNSPPTFIQFVDDIANSGTCYYDVKGTFGTGNGTGTIATITYKQHMWGYQFGALSTPIIKTAGQQLQVNFRASWGRYTP